MDVGSSGISWCVFVSPFALDVILSILQLPNFDFSFTNQHFNAVPHPRYPCAQRRAHYDYSVNFF